MAYSLMHEVAKVVCTRGTAIAPDVWAEFPAYTERQIRVALRNALARGHLSVIDITKLPGRRVLENVYAAPDARAVKSRKPIKAISSVWDYAKKQEQTWHP